VPQPRDRPAVSPPMETVIQDHTPLADYLKGARPPRSPLSSRRAQQAQQRSPSEMASWTLTAFLLADEGEEQEHHHETWATPAASDSHDDSPPPSPSFAPVGRPTVRKRFRPDPLPLDLPHMNRLRSLRNSYSVSIPPCRRVLAGGQAVADRVVLPALQKAVVSRIDRADNLKFIEQFRYTIVASQLLSGHSIAAQQNYHGRPREPQETPSNAAAPTSTGVLATAAAALVVAWVVRWVYSGGYAHLTKKRVSFSALILVAVAVVSQAYLRQQWLRYLRDQALAEVTTFVARSQDFDSASSAALSLIQEVELVSRGYRM